jgi:hypothetical protein
MSRGRVIENEEDFFFLTGAESGFLRRPKKYPFGRLEKCLTFPS